MSFHLRDIVLTTMKVHRVQVGFHGPKRKAVNRIMNCAKRARFGGIDRVISAIKFAMQREIRRA